MTMLVVTHVHVLLGTLVLIVFQVCVILFKMEKFFSRFFLIFFLNKSISLHYRLSMRLRDMCRCKQ